MTRKELVLSKLVVVSDSEWLAAMAKCHEHMKLKLKRKTLTGAHSTAVLSMPAPEYYLTNAIQKLYEPEGWDWKFEKYTLTEQLIRIINSMISEQVRKYKVEKANNPAVHFTDDDDVFETEDQLTEEEAKERESAIDEFLVLTEEAIKGDDNLETLYLHLMENKSYPDIAKEMNIDIKKVYKLAEKLKEKVKKQAAEKTKTD